MAAIGCDLQFTRSVAQACSAHGGRYLRAILVGSELNDLRAPADSPAVAIAVAARFALKEAVFKCLQVAADEAFPWTDVVTRPVSSAPSGQLSRSSELLSGTTARWAAGGPTAIGGVGGEWQRWSVQLGGHAARYARRAGIGGWIAHTSAWNHSVQGWPVTATGDLAAESADLDGFVGATVLALAGAKS